MEGFSQPANTGGLNIDLGDVPISSGFPVLPKGDYLVQYERYDDKETRAGGRMLVVSLTVIGGEHNERKIRRNFNYVNDNNDVARRAISEIKTFLLACFGGQPPADFRMSTALQAALGSELVASVSLNKNGENEIYVFYTKSGHQITADGGLVPVNLQPPYGQHPGAAPQQAFTPPFAGAPAATQPSPQGCPTPPQAAASPQVVQMPSAGGPMPWQSSGQSG